MHAFSCSFIHSYNILHLFRANCTHWLLGFKHHVSVVTLQYYGSYSSSTSPDCDPSGTGGPSGAGGNNVGLNI